jgi:hypothetical protein
VQLSEGQHQLTLTVTDEGGNVENDTRLVNVGPPNRAPLCDILAPEDRTGVVLGSTVELQGQATDPDVAADTLEVVWESSLDGVLGTPRPTSSGDFSLPVSSLSAGSHAITLAVTDDGGLTCTAQIVVNVGSAPSLTVANPLPNARYALGDAVTLDATASDPDDPASALTVTWTSNLDGELSSATPDSSGRSLDTRIDLSRGRHVLDVVVEDSIGLTAREQVSFVVNGPPTAPDVAITPDPAGSLDTLGAVVLTDAVDAEGDPVTYVYSWFRDGVVTPVTTATVTPDQTQAGEVWRVDVRGSDGELEGPAGSASVEIGDALPTVTNVRVTPSAPRNADDLTCAHDPAVDPDGDPATVSYAWSVDGADAGYDTPLLPATATSRGSSVTCTVTPEAGGVVGLPRTSAPVVVLNAPPVVGAVTLTPPSPTVGQALSCQASGLSDPDGDTVTVAWSWEVDGLAQPTTTETLPAPPRGAGVRCGATPNDGLLDGTTVWSLPVTTVNGAPVAEIPTITPSPATTVDELTCQTAGATDPDGDPVTLSVTWRVDGAVVATDTETLDAGIARRGDSVSCEVTPDDGTVLGDTVSSAAIVLLNAAPSATGVSISPTLAITSTTLQAEPTGFSDPDGDDADWRYDWQVGGVTVGTEATLPASTLVRGEVVTVTATPFDGVDTGAPVTSAPLTIANAIPTAPEVLVLPDDPAELEQLRCDVVTASSDEDGDPIDYRIEWTADGVPFTGAITTVLPGDTVPAGLTARSETWRCVVTPNDGLSDGPSDADAAIIACEPEPELCDLLDSDCNGDLVDDFGDVDLDGLPDCVDDDDDGDGFDDATDCDSSDPTIYPGAPEVYNDGIDQDCSGSDVVTCWVDADGDGRGGPCLELDDGLPSQHTGGDTGWVDCILVAQDGDCDDPGEAWDGFDCDDNDPLVNPDVDEVCNDIDDNCDGQVDEGVQITLYTDADGDGYGTGGAFGGCAVGPGTTLTPGDCDDGDAGRAPDLVEVCNDVDDDCNGVVDDNLRTLFYADADGDGFGTAATIEACTRPAGYADTLGDCDDSRADRSPGLTEQCNGFDDDCDNAVDEGLLTTFFQDGDGDGWGSSTTLEACTLPAGYATRSGDCDDGVAGTSPDGVEVCNGVDDDCDNSTDEGLLIDVYTDGDGDGFGTGTAFRACSVTAGFSDTAGDCADGDGTRFPGAVESCNTLDDDCDSLVDEGVQTTYYRDADGDSWGTDETRAACSVPAGYTTRPGDCDDGAGAVNPGGTETCNGFDDNCDSAVDEGVQTTYFRDVDGDGFGTSETQLACSRPSGFATQSGDCDDGASTAFPGAPEICNGADDDCDASTDEGVQNTYYLDGDGDGFGTSSTTQACSRPAGYADQPGDCNDGVGTAFPGAAETCNGLDDDCDNSVDEGAQNTYYLDSDGDGFGTSSTTQACARPAGYATQSGDCNDAVGTAFPGATESCNGLDDDCDNSVDEGVQNTYFRDGDGDTYGDGGATTQACSVPSGYATRAGDCADGDASRNPGATEVCNSADDDCDNSVDEGVTNTYYRDVDGDSWGVAATTIQACSVPSGYADRTGDCADGDASRNPGATEVCNGTDDDCDSNTDEGVTTTYYQDNDGDSWGSTATTQACSVPSGFATRSGDCNDSAASSFPGATEVCNGADDDCNDSVGSRNPGATEVCNGADDDCDNSTDEGVTNTYYLDADGDTWGSSTTTQACSVPGGYVTRTGDCNDSAASRFPGATEVCNGVDDDCDNSTDEGVTNTYYRDSDGDTYGSSTTTQACSVPSGYATRGGDCNDSAASRFPGATEVCNGVDDDCDNSTDEGVTNTYYRDADGDTWGTSSTTQACSVPSGYATRPGDCADSNAARNPGAEEICNGVDDDCDASTDEDAGTAWYADWDDDGWGDRNNVFLSCTQPAGYVSQPGDCMDFEPWVNPDAIEICNGLDDNCNGIVDLDATFIDPVLCDQF